MKPSDCGLRQRVSISRALRRGPAWRTSSACGECPSTDGSRQTPQRRQARICQRRSKHSTAPGSEGVLFSSGGGPRDTTLVSRSVPAMRNAVRASLIRTLEMLRQYLPEARIRLHLAVLVLDTGGIVGGVDELSVIRSDVCAAHLPSRMAARRGSAIARALRLP